MISAIYYVSTIVLLIGILLELICLVKSKDNSNVPVKRSKKNVKYAVLIPARYESSVIEQLLKSIKKQNEDMSNVYVIIESEKDKTNEIASFYNANVFIRKELDKKRKGYALDECFRYLKKKNIKYDLYFIFDADNILGDNYFNEMIKSYYEGYDLVISYRDSKNGNESIVSAASTLTFSMINTLINKNKNKCNGNVTVSGTGYFISSNIVDKWDGFPFNSLTEDYEITLYSVQNELCTYYNENAKFYDEQPTTYAQSKTQRTRWIKGFFEARKKYISLIRRKNMKECKNKGSVFQEKLGVSQFLVMIAGIIGLLIGFIVSFITAIINKDNYMNYVFLFISLILVVYLALVIFTAILLIKEGNKLNLNKKSKFKVLFYNPIFLASYLSCFIKSLTNRNVEWQKIEHNQKNIV